MKTSSRRFRIALFSLFTVFGLLAGCSAPASNPAVSSPTSRASASSLAASSAASSNAPASQADSSAAPASKAFSLADVPSYSGKPYVPVNNNAPTFAASDCTTKSFERYSDLDSLGRCGAAYANVGIDTMPTEDRGSIGSIKPSGWHTVKYDNVDGKYLYNRCHLIGYQLTAENANPKNLITGTRYLNVEGMLPFENMVADYIKETKHHVLYRVTPIFEGNNLVATGVHMEAYSVEDKGEGISYNVFVYNVQPGITIDYATGDSKSATHTSSGAPASQAESAGALSAVSKSEASTNQETSGETYILNKNTKKFHRPSCPDATKISKKNQETYAGSRDQLISQGYSPCKKCNP